VTIRWKIIENPEPDPEGDRLLDLMQAYDRLSRNCCPDCGAFHHGDLAKHRREVHGEAEE
jgi:hypothetical protein